MYPYLRDHNTADDFYIAALKALEQAHEKRLTGEISEEQDNIKPYLYDGEDYSFEAFLDIMLNRSEIKDVWVPTDGRPVG